MKVYVIRHGESESNLKKQWTGWADAPLTDKGKSDAALAGDVIQTVRFDKVYTSDLKRAMGTAEIALPHCPYEASSLLREINVGQLAGQPLSALTYEQRVDTIENGYAPFGGESHAALLDRIGRFMDGLESLHCENVAVFSHAGWLLGMLEQVLGVRLPKRNICCHNCTVAVFEYIDGVWKLYSWINVV